MYHDHYFAFGGSSLAVGIYQVPQKSVSAYTLNDLAQFGSKSKPMLQVMRRYAVRFPMAAPCLRQGVLTEPGDLVSHIGDVASRALLKEVELSDNGVVVKCIV